MEDTEGLPLPFLPRTIHFPNHNNTSYDLLKPLTNFKSCHDGTPPEARILFTCRPTSPISSSPETCIVKIKVQIPTEADPNPIPHPGPSDTTTHELAALKIFTAAKTPFAPHLITFKTETQGPEGKVPGGYVTFTVMSMMPGLTLYPELKYWNLMNEERDDIVRGFLGALKGVWDLGIEPVDRGLRNVLWEAESKTW